MPLESACSSGCFLNVAARKWHEAWKTARGGSVRRVWGAWNGINLCEARTHRKCSSISLRLQHPGQRMLRSDSADLPTSWANIWQRFADFCAACVSTGVGVQGGVPGPGISRWSFTQSHSRCRCRRRRPMTPNFFIMYFALLLFIYHRCYSLIESLKVIRASAAAMTCKPVEGRVREAGLCLPYGVPLVASWHLTWQQQKREQKQLQGTASSS